MEHKARTRALSWLLSLVMILSLVPGMSITAYAAGVSYVDGSGESKTVDATELEATTTNWTDGSWYIVPAGGLTISSRIKVNGTVNLILRDGATLIASAGITTTGATLNIYAQSAGTGALTAKGSTGCAGIGGRVGGYGSNGGAGGTVSIFGGTVTATGGTAANSDGAGAGIGGGGAGLGMGDTGGAGGTVSIFGGTVTATGGTANSGGGAGAGIGGGGKDKRGSDGASGTLTLGKGVKLYNGTNNSGTVLDGSDSTERTYSGSRPQNMFASDHSHSFSYTADGNTITATCGADGCKLPPSSEGCNDHVATLTIAAPQHTAVGDGKSADAQITDANKIQGSATVSYFNANDNDTKGSALGSAPAAVGKYWAEITVSDATAHVVYEITNPEYEITLPTGLAGGTVAAAISQTDVTKAHYNDTVTLTVTPADHFTLKSLTVKDSSNKNVTVTVEEDTRTFTMPASNVTVSAEFEGEPFGITTEVSPANGGTVTISGTGVENPQTGTTAKAGSTVTLTVNADTGFNLQNVTVKKANGDTVTVTDNKFTMPTEAVTVSATFVGKDTTATLAVTGNEGTTCTAKLLDANYKEIDSVTKKGGEPFILLVNRDEGYDFNVTYGNSPVTLTEFTEAQYKAYDAKDNNITLSSNMVLAWVTMPGVAEDSVTLTVKFSKLKTFTILYQPTEKNTAAVWCKFAKSGSTTAGASRMHNDAEMGDGNKVFSLKVTAADNPDQLAFVTTEDSLNSAPMITGVTVSQNTNTWNNITQRQDRRCGVCDR